MDKGGTDVVGNLTYISGLFVNTWNKNQYKSFGLDANWVAMASSGRFESLLELLMSSISPSASDFVSGGDKQSIKKRPAFDRPTNIIRATIGGSVMPSVLSTNE